MLPKTYYLCNVMWKAMRHLPLYLFAVLLFYGCGEKVHHEARSLQGLWLLVRVVYPDDTLIEYDYPNSNGDTKLSCYDGDSACYVFDVRFVKDAISVCPESKVSYTLINRGNGDMLYLEGTSRRPLRFINDTTIVIQRFGAKYTMIRANGFVRERAGEILDIARDHDFTKEEPVTRFFISKAEKELRKTNNTLLYILTLLFLVAAAVIAYAVRTRLRNRRLKLRLRQIAEERESRPVKVDKALREVESDFMQSEYYTGIRRRIAHGERLTTDDWHDMERRLRSVYPNFTNRLRELVSMSDTEYHVCMLIKLRVAPKEIADVLCKEKSTISSIRSRLYQKVFHKKGSSAEWDNFVWSL